MTRKRKTDARKRRKLQELKVVQNNDRNTLKDKQGGSVNPVSIGRASNNYVTNSNDGTVSK